jgi:hypothetical protein
MDNVLDPVIEVQDRIIDAISRTKQPLTDAVSQVVDAILGRVPEIPVLPYAERIPTPAELIENQAKFASKLVSTNKSVALSAAKAAAPLTDKLLDRSSVAAARKTSVKAA